MKFGTHEDLKKKLNGKTTFGREDCPFCRDLKTGDRIIWRGNKWAILKNNYPYIDSAEHIMLIPIEHIQFSCEITPETYNELSDAYKYINSFFMETPYFSFTRETLEERSVEHLHTHFLPGKIPRNTIVDMLEAQGFHPVK